MAMDLLHKTSDMPKIRITIYTLNKLNMQTRFLLFQDQEKLLIV